MKEIKVNDVVQFNETNKWVGCIGIVEEVKGDILLVGVAIPKEGTAYMRTLRSEIEYIGKAVLIPQAK